MPKASPGKATLGPRAAARPTPKVSTPFQDDPEEAFTINPGNKERRAAADFKSRWVHDEINPTHLQNVKKQSEEIFGVEVSKLMWCPDFKKPLQVIDKMLGLILS